jgi:hypothetical protein
MIQLIVQNFIIQNVFNDDQLSHINDILKKNEQNILLDRPQFGRTRYDFKSKDLGIDLILFLNKTAKKYNKNLNFIGCYYSEYSLKYGTPELAIHTDRTSATFTIDYQLDANIDWDVYVEGIPFSLKNNQAVTINVNSQAHWRPRKNFSEGEYLKMIYFHFADKSIKEPRILSNEEILLLQEKWNHLWEFPENLNKF